MQDSHNGMFNWNPIQQGLVLGCYFYGYIFSNIIGGWLSKRFGFRLILGGSVFMSAVMTILTPIAAKLNFELFVALRVLLGFVAVSFLLEIFFQNKNKSPFELPGLSTESSKQC